MPIMGFGTSSITDPSSFITAVKVGFRHFDTATRYQNEQFIGEAITKCINDGVVTR